MQIRISAALAATILTSAPALAQDEGIHWLSSYPQALAEARRTGKPVFLEYRCEP